MKNIFKKSKPGDPKAAQNTALPDPPTAPLEPPTKATSEEEAYLSRLASSVINRPSKDVNVGAFRQGGPSATPPPIHPAHTPLPVAPRHTPPPVPRPTPPPLITTPEPRARRSRSEVPVLGRDGSFTVGTILFFEDQSIGVFKDQRADKDYEVVYLLKPDGSVQPQGIALENYDIKVIGALPPEFMMRLQRRLRWDRDEIIYHLDNFDYCALVPAPAMSAIHTPSRESRELARAPTPAPVAVEKKTLAPGRRLTIAFGPNQKWEAVYWGEDELGPVLAHNTHDKWALMHLDLSRFGDGVVLGEMAPPDLMEKIRADIA